MKGDLLRKPASLGLTLMFVTASWLTSATGLTPTFQVYARDGTPINNNRLEYLLDPASSVRIGIEVRPDTRIGFDSKHGLGIVIDF